MKFIFFSIISIGILFYSQVQQISKEDEILWNQNRKLTWDDFKGVPDNNDKAAARTNCAINSSFSQKKDSLFFVIEAIARKSRSWVKSDAKTISGLEHEQLHFDITELSVRLIRKKISGTFFNKKTADIQCDKIINEGVINFRKMQEQYDLESNHHLNKVKQKEWEKKVAAELLKLKDYQVTTIKTVVAK